ncbi:MAG: DUF2652 domain-containing protein [Candidatus Limnocylindria bacterium]
MVRRDLRAMNEESTDAVPPAPHAERGFLLLGDISGYTRFLATVAAAHPEMTAPGATIPPAYPVLTSLLNVVVDRVTPQFTLSEIEGDAVFAYSPGELLNENGDALLAMLASVHHAFHRRIEEARVLQNHECQACVIISILDLKFVLHWGTFVVQPIAGRMKLVGPEINVAHRLLKNSVTDQTGLSAYALVTQTAARQLGLLPDAGVAHREDYPDTGPIGTILIDLHGDRTTT